MVRIKIKDLKKNKGLWNYYHWGKVFDNLNRFDELSSRQITLLGNKIFSLLDWDRIKCKALAELADFNGKVYELKLNQRAIKSAKVLHDEKELKDCVRDFLDHNFVGYYGDEWPSAIFDYSWDNYWEKVKWLENEMVREVEAFILQEITEKAYKKSNYENKWEMVYHVADYLDIKDLMVDMDYNIVG